MIYSSRSTALKRARSLFEGNPSYPWDKPQCPIPPEQRREELGIIKTYLLQADVSLSPLLVIVLLLGFALILTVGAVCVLSPYFLPLFFLAGAYLPYSWLERRIRIRAASFAADYPTILLATASSIKAGMTVQNSIERSVRLLPKNSLARQEVEKLATSLARGVTKEQALEAFGATVRQPDLALFRAAFALALTHGGRFAPTLQRLARVCNDRGTLIRTAQVRTTTMRMTANVLLVIAPLIVTMVAFRTAGYWDIFLNHPLANTLATIGVVTIGCSYLILLRMSDFKP